MLLKLGNFLSIIHSITVFVMIFSENLITGDEPLVNLFFIAFFFLFLSKKKKKKLQ